MEQHPVPQNVTTFQFRLIGDMTVKQFGYLAAGAIAAYISFKLPLPFFFTWPLTIASALLGFGLAFVPIEERPMDVWIMAFLKNVYSPTQYVWQKTKAAAPPAEAPAPPKAPPAPPLPVTPAVSAAKPPTAAPTSPTSQLVDRLFSDRPAAVPPMETPVLNQPPIPPPSSGPSVVLSEQKPKTGAFDWITKLFETKPPASPTGPGLTGEFPGFAPATPAPAKPPAAPEVKPDSRVKDLEENLAKLKKELAGTALSEKRILELQQQLTATISQKERLEKEVVSLRQRADQPAPTPSQFPRPASGTLPPSSVAPTVRVMTPDVAVKAGLPKLTTFPNIVTGIVKDGSGNLLSGVLVTVRDKNDIPLRALKTNKLGQFAASTQLPNGTYLLEVEDPRGNFTFDRVQINVSGALVPAVEIFAKSQRQIDRDKLARELFGNQTP